LFTGLTADLVADLAAVFGGFFAPSARGLGPDDLALAFLVLAFLPDVACLNFRPD
jgi:hypothetical protein